MSSDSEDNSSFLSQVSKITWVDTKDRFWKVLATYKDSSYDKLNSYKLQTEATLKYGSDYFIEAFEPYHPHSWSSVQVFSTHRSRFLKNYNLAERVSILVLLTGGVFMFSRGIRLRLLNTVLTGGLGMVTIAPELINPLKKQ